MEKKEWKQPALEMLEVSQTFASKNWGVYDEGYNADLGEQGQTGVHHGS